MNFIWFHLVENEKYFIFTLNFVSFILLLPSTEKVSEIVHCSQMKSALFGTLKNDLSQKFLLGLNLQSF